MAPARPDPRSGPMLDAPHLDPVAPAETRPARPSVKARLWRPKRLIVTEAARATAIAETALDRAEALGLEVVHASGNAVRGLKGETEAETYRRAKSTLAIVRSPPSARKLQPIPPSADFRLDLATGCPAHCQYCYLAGSLSGPPVTRAYGDLDAILAVVPDYAGQGRITSASEARAHEGTTFEGSCYTDPLAIEPLTGSLSRAVARFAQYRADGLDVSFRFTTKYDAVGPLTALDHGGATRARFSINVPAITRRFEGGTAPLEGRLAAMGAMARAGYPVGLTIAPIMPVEGWEAAYDRLFADVAAALPEGADVTAELITHRFTPGSRDVLLGWYPATALEMDEAVRTQKRNKFGGVKYVYPKERMKEMREALEASLRARLPAARLLYWT